MKILIAILALIIIAGAVFFIYLNSGMYNIGATTEHTGMTLWMIEKLKDNSIKNHASGIEEPGNLSDSSMILAGFGHYDENCLECHGAIGIAAEPFARGLYPEAPDLQEEVEEWTAAELFWITKYGIKMTGMPAFAETHNDQQIWEIVAFLKQYPQMGYYDYLEMREKPGSQHEHGQEAEDHEHD